MLNKTDVALVVIDPTVGIAEEETVLIAKIEQKKIPLHSRIQQVRHSHRARRRNKRERGDRCGHKRAEGSASHRSKCPNRRGWKGCACPATYVRAGNAHRQCCAPKGLHDTASAAGNAREVLDNHGIVPLVQPEELEGCASTLNGRPRIVITDCRRLAAYRATCPRTYRRSRRSRYFSPVSAISERSN